MKDNNINALLDLTEDDLYYKLGQKLDYTIMGIDPEQRKKGIIALSREWYAKNKNPIKEVICTSKNLHTILSHETPVSVVKVIGDIIVHHFLGFPAIEIAVIIFREGVNKICNNNES